MTDVCILNRRTVIKAIAGGVGIAATGGLAAPAIAQGAEISIIASETNPAAVAALRAAADAFKKQGGATVVVNNMDMEANKTAIRNYLVAGAPDLCFWYSGNRMRAFVERGLFEDLSDLFAAQKYADVLGPTAGSVTVDGKQ
ncbi:ABC-type glycerol-3-phosphate transport system substrate-binding protein [Aureimonas pseudogalii]|uniref:ABC-type glycerol-3-phosphate transport system substrate-binding protein n=1 Tax=Aureimonas pseudogalii TaxID=1744844 RepID=A0A7W6H8Z6_9HYPH|nr:ABC-type glycerol-3-phosphate transport system substrate-binding protein [Aureimonas pseudogalii]